MAPDTETERTERLERAVSELVGLLVPQRFGGEIAYASDRQRMTMDALAPAAMAIWDELHPEDERDPDVHHQGRRADPLHGGDNSWPDPFARPW
jgi:hypothetical protein